MRAKRVIVAVIVVALLGVTAAFACVYDAEGRARVYQGDFYCESGGHGCQECTVVDQSGGYMTCVYWNGRTYCSGRDANGPFAF